MRVISGKAKGFKLLSVPGDSTRPISDRVKTSLFNIIGPDIEKANILDLFAGTGSVGIEALSRGANYALFIDNNLRAISTINRNLSKTKLGVNARVLKSDALNYLKNQQTFEFDYIYIAPPQYKGLWIKSISLLDENPGWLSRDGWIIVQIHPKEYQKIEPENFSEFDKRKYGSTLLVFYSS
jgi:16S rRNA (guanine(966)-N(2))-methyltransferase RsmD